MNNITIPKRCPHCNKELNGKWETIRVTQGSDEEEELIGEFIHCGKKECLKKMEDIIKNEI